MVYDATRSGFNDVVWYPWFPIPTTASHLRSAKVGTFMGDCYIGEMFLNFMLDPTIRPNTGVDFTDIFREKFKTSGGSSLEVW